MKIVQTYELACEITGDNPNNLPDVSVLSEAMGKHVLATIKLNALERAQNKGCMRDGSDFVPDFGNINQLKYTPWLDWVPSLRRFVCTFTSYTSANTGLGARFWFANAETAREWANTHIDLINDLMHPELAINY